MAKEERKVISNNRKAGFDYELIEFYEAGIVLTGTEVKSLRAGAVNMRDSYGYIKDYEAYVSGMHISHYEKGNINNVDPDRERKLLMHKSEIRKLVLLMQQKGYTLVPTKMYFVKNKVKLELALAKGKKKFDKRDSIKKNEADREIQKRMKESNHMGA
ncbi:MAG TPA: SsrA-binding protein SmpB [Clostridia bacterium]|nr:MAG: SsrA-binding protein [Firmicutes bacterium ADurb.Bin146]HOD93615.1 SsrA-binding protein SmpB [Clostridia bacterium]HQM40054.1 SsrA-binding protein SmpB [Clostridia bacterium]